MSLISSVENLPKQQSLDGVENDVFQMPITNEIIPQIQQAPESIQSINNLQSSENNQIINYHNRESTTSVSSVNTGNNEIISGNCSGGTGNNQQPENPVLSFNVEITPPQQCSNSVVMPPDGATCLPDVVPKINQRLLKHR